MTGRLRWGGPSSGVAAAWPFLLLALLLSGPWPAAAQWVSAPGEGWVQLSVYHQFTRTEFDRERKRDGLENEAEAVNTVAFLTVNAGLLPGLDVWAQVPWQRVEFNDALQDRTQTGFGDTRVWLRTAPLAYLGVDFPLAIRGGVKFPVSDFQVDSEIISLTDGQTDWELMLEVGHSFWPRSLWVAGWAGYRWREENEEILRDFGNQAFFLLQGGGRAGPIGYKLVVEGFDGETPTIEGLQIASAERELFQIAPTLSYPVGPGHAELGAQIPLFGRNQLAGPSLVVGYFTEWSAF